MERIEAPIRSDEGWPYPDGADEPAAADEVDLDILEIRVDPHLYDALDDTERAVLVARFGLADGRARSMKQLAHDHGITHAEVRDVLEHALDKIKARLAVLDDG